MFASNLGSIHSHQAAKATYLGRHAFYTVLPHKANPKPS